MERTGAGTAALLSGSLSVANAAGRERVTFAIVSDTHIGYRGKDSARKQWLKTADEVAKLDVSFVLHLGDVVDGGRVELYPVYREIRERITRPMYEIPGNHDPTDAFAQHIRKPVDTVMDHGWLRCILLNNARRDSHDGFFTEQQLDWLGRQLEATKRDNRLAIICCHVPVHPNRHPDRGWYVKPEHGQKQFYDLASAHREVLVAAFHGHFHNGIRGWNDHSPLHEICCPSALYNLNRRLEEQQAPGYNPIEFRPGYTMATIGEGTLQLQYRPTGEEASVKVDLPSV
ncbi:MAG: metallophosphoesterase family protein [Planctomycetota bacterium]|jgi:DNA repair exonuclease SbcCD nuclease subunit